MAADAPAGKLLLKTEELYASGFVHAVVFDPAATAKTRVLHLMDSRP